MNGFETIKYARTGIFTLLKPTQKRRTIKIYFLSILLGIADIIGLGSMVPVLMLAIDHSFLEKSSKLRFIFNTLGFESEAIFLKALILVIILFFIVKTFVAIWLQKYIRKVSLDIAASLSSGSYDAAFANNTYEKVSADGLGFNDTILFTPYYFVSGIYIPFINIVSESAISVMLVVFFTVYEPMIFFLIVGLLGTAFFLVSRYTRKKISDLGEKASRDREKSLKSLNFGISGFTDIKTHAAEEFFKTRFMFNFKSFVLNGIKALNYQLIPARVNEFVSLLGIVVLVIYAYFYSGDNLGKVRVLAALFAISVFRLIPAANRILQGLMHLKMNAYTITKLTSLLKTEKESNNRISEFHSEINIKDIDFAYPEKRDQQIFRQLNLTIPKGKIIGISGKSGSGKTTLVKLLLGFYKPDSGKIYIDKTSIENGSDAQKLFAYLGQDPFLISGSVADNVAFGIDTDKRDLNRIKESLLKAAFILDENTDPDKQQVGESGARLSEGQRQRLILARELYRNAPVLILDEPTSSLDSETENIILKTLQKLKEESRTILIIAHRERIFEICDQVYFLKDKKLYPKE